MNPLKQLGELFGKKKDESVVGIDIGSSSIKVVQLKEEHGKAVLETYGAVSLGPFTDKEIGRTVSLGPDRIAEALTSVLKEANVTTKRAFVSIMSSSSLVFVLTLPARVNKKDFAKIIPTEARKYIPISVNEVTIDWWVIPKRDDYYETLQDTQKSLNDGTQPTEVLVVAIHNDTLRNYREIAKAAGISVELFELEVFSGIRATFTHDFEATALLDIGALKTKLAISEQGIVRSFHLINRGAAQITESLSTSMGITFEKAESIKREFGLRKNVTETKIEDIIRGSLSLIITDAKTAILNYEKKHNKPVEKVILIGGGSLLKKIDELLTKELEREVILGDPFIKTDAPAFLTDALQATGPEFAVAVGLALKPLQQSK